VNKFKTTIAALGVAALVAGLTSVAPAAQAASATVPDAPASLTAIPGNTTVLLAWAAPANGGSPITGYNLYEGTTPGGESATPVNDGTLASGTTLTVNGLTNAQTYYFTAKAVNGIGSSVASTEAWAIPAATMPASPTAVVATAGNASATVNWTAPSSVGGSAISRYTVTAADSTTPAKGGQTCTWSSGPLSCALSGLSNGDSYTFSVTATNSLGTSVASNASSAVVPAVTVPSAPTALIATPGNTNVVLSWTAPANGGSTITGYNVYKGTTSGGENYAVAVNGTTLVSGTTVTVSSLSNSQSYYFTVKAVNATGASSASSEVWAIPSGTVPSTPTAVAASPGHVSAIVSWVAPNPGGAAITRYTVTAADSTTPSKGGQTCTWSSGPLSCVLSGLSNGDSYTFSVTATNSLGTSAPSSASSAIVPTVTEPLAPTNLVATPGNHTVLLSWTAPVSGGSIITGYNIYQGNSPGGESANAVNGTIFVTNTSAIVSGLNNAHTYYFTVEAVNALGSSLDSSEVWAIPSATVAAVPMGVIAIAGTNGTATIVWSVPMSSGGSAITGYVVTPYIGSSAQAASSFNSTLTAETVSGLAPGTSYSFAVAAINASGTGAASENSNVVSFAKATTKTALKLSANGVTFGHEQVEIISVTVSPQYPGMMPTGSVTISGTDCHVTVVAGKGSCTLSGAKFASGFFHPVGSYAGSTNFTSSVSGGMSTLSVARAATTTALKLSAVKATYGHEQAEHISVSVSSQYSGVTATGTVTISGTPCRINLSAGKGSCTLSSKTFRTGFFHPIATYGGNANFKGSKSGGFSTLTVVK
jgi:hypothetical protein